MISALAYGCCALTLITAAEKMRSARGRPMSVSRRYLIAAIVAFGLALTASAPATLAYTASLQPIPRLVADVLAMVSAFCVLGVTDYSVSGKTWPGYVLGHSGWLLACVAAMAGLILGADVHHTHGFLATHGRDPLIVAYLSMYLGYMSWCLSRFIWRLRHYAQARDAHPLMRRGFQVTALGASIGMIGVAWKAAGLVLLAVSGRAVHSHYTLSQILAVCAVATGAAGATYTSWAPALLNLRERWRVWRLTRALGPLWRRLIEAVPHVQFMDDPSTSLVTLMPAERAEYRLYRRTLEIRDAQLALRPYIPPDVPGWALAAAERHNLDSASTDLLIEAAGLATALDAHDSRHRPESTNTVRPRCPYSRSTPNLFAEARQLTNVSSTMRRHLVAELCERATLDRALGHNNTTRPSYQN